MKQSNAIKTLPGWAEQMRALESVGDNLMARWGIANPSEADYQAMYKLALSALTEGYLDHVYPDPYRPLWMPLWNHAINLAGPSPDYVYKTTVVEADGVYCISGFRGTNLFVEITQQGWVILGEEGTRTPSPATHDLDDLTLDENGYFSVILSAERPSGYDGDWWQLHAITKRLLMRLAAYDWTNEKDAQVAIERLDDKGPEPSAEDIANRFSDMAKWIEGVIGFDIDLARYYREHHGLNRLERSKVIDDIGGLPNQVYYDGTHEINDDEALILETELPAKCRYWSVLVSDDRFSTVDWINHQSSLNGLQARLDADGKFRAVISRRDPGIHNWLDKADKPSGIMQLRWNKPSDAPDPSMKKVPFADIRKHLPSETPTISSEERKEQLRRRREGAQMRNLW